MPSDGADFERAILPWLKILWPRARRNGKGFKGTDFSETEEFGIEAKKRKEMRLAAWVKQVQQDTANEQRRFPVVIHKRRMYGPQGAYVTMSLEDWVAMLATERGIELPEDLYPVSDEDTERPDWADD